MSHLFIGLLLLLLKYIMYVDAFKTIQWKWQSRNQTFRNSHRLLHLKFNEYFKGYHIRKTNLSQVLSTDMYLNVIQPYIKHWECLLKIKVVMDPFVREKTKYANLPWHKACKFSTDFHTLPIKTIHLLHQLSQ